MKITDTVARFLLSPLLGGILFLVVYRLEFRYYSALQILIIFAVGVLLVLVPNLFSEIIKELYGGGRIDERR
jgi:hypothetical protein